MLFHNGDVVVKLLEQPARTANTRFVQPLSKNEELFDSSNMSEMLHGVLVPTLRVFSPVFHHPPPPPPLQHVAPPCKENEKTICPSSRKTSDTR